MRVSIPGIQLERSLELTFRGDPIPVIVQTNVRERIVCIGEGLIEK
jgi:hypothetical protein